MASLLVIIRHRYDNGDRTAISAVLRRGAAMSRLFTAAGRSPVTSYARLLVQVLKI